MSECLEVYILCDYSAPSAVTYHYLYLTAEDAKKRKDGAEKIIEGYLHSLVVRNNFLNCMKL
jgi:hypothetical protein